METQLIRKQPLVEYLKQAARRTAMDIPYFTCEDCGHEFEKTEFMPDVEDDDVVECPACGGLDIQLVDRATAEDAHE